MDSAILMEKGWYQVLKDDFDQPYMKELEKFLKTEYEGQQEIFPTKNEIFNAFHQTPFEQVKVVIIGQDPYHNPSQAHGLSFSVVSGVRTPPSLQNIYKEIEKDLGLSPPNHGCLLSWAKQGVLLLNATLTVRKNEPKSHYGRGWERFTDAVIQKLAQEKSGIIFLLWGRSAKEKCAHLSRQNCHILEAAHPSPFAAHKGFFGCRHFSKVNEILNRQGQDPINWKLQPV